MVGLRRGVFSKHRWFFFFIVWWVGVDYELISGTLCTYSDFLVMHSLGYVLMFQLRDQFILLICTILHTNPKFSATVHTLTKKKLFYQPFS